MKQKKEVVMFEIFYTCDRCNIGLMKYTGRSMIMKPKYLHKCTECGNKQFLNDIYPHLKAFDKDQEI